MYVYSPDRKRVYGRRVEVGLPLGNEVEIHSGLAGRPAMEKKKKKKKRPMPRREDPKIHVREGIVAAFYPGASAAEVENQVTQKVEQRLFKIEGVRREKTYSTSMNGAMFINLNLEDNLQDTEKFWSKLRLDMAELKKTDLPDGVQGPAWTTTSEIRSRCCWRFIATTTATAS